jgi:protein-disulfide isomerase
MQEREHTVRSGEIAQVISSRGDQIFNDPETPIGGNPSGDVSLVEFFDYNCPYCRKVAATLVAVQSGDPKLRIVYKEWPILGPNSESAARLALASRRQGRYAEFHRALILSDTLVDDSKALAIAATLGLDVSQLKLDAQSPEITAAIERNHKLAQTLRITGTPSFVIGEEVLRGAVEEEVIIRLIRQVRVKQVETQSRPRNLPPTSTLPSPN